MTSFFDFTIEYTNSGFGMFSLWHFAWLAAGGLLWGLLCRAYRHADTAKRRKMRLCTALTALFTELLRALLLILAGEYGIARLPLHLCGMAVYFCAGHAAGKRTNGLVGQFLYAFCMPGAFAALLFPDWTYYPALHFMTFSSFVLHILIVLYVLMQTSGGDILPDIRKTPACLALMLALAVPVYVFDRLTGMNYMFLNWPSAGSPLELFAFLGRPAYILGYLPIIAAAWALMYCPWRKKLPEGKRSKSV